jgi:hypothetical protein
VTAGPRNIVPLSIDMSAVVRRSVASLYSHLVTRPTGQALRMGIESQLSELGEYCVSILDFTGVIVLDYSCADEAVAKLILRYQRDDRPTEVYFIARGVAEQHLEPIEAVLSRHALVLVTEVVGSGYDLIGPLPEVERAAWTTVQELSSALPRDVAARVRCTESTAAEALEALANRRALARAGATYIALSSLVAGETSEER